MRTRTALAIATALVLSTAAGSAQATTSTTTNNESWSKPTTAYQATTPTTELTTVTTKKALDRRALRLTLPKNAGSGPNEGVGVSSVEQFRYGTFSTRMRTADCRSQKQAGVVTGTFTYANDGQDHDGDGITDNDEIDIEFLCAQPEVVYLTIWTQYSETSDQFDATTRTIDLSTGTIVSTCHRTSWAGDCLPTEPGELLPTKVAAIKKFNSASTFRTYGFDWQPDHVTYFTYDDSGRQVLLWNYRGANIPDTKAPFMQNVWHSGAWDPIGRSAHEATTRPVSALIDTTTVTS